MSLRLRVFLGAPCAFSCGKAEAAAFSNFNATDEGWTVVNLRYPSVGSPPAELSAAVAPSYSATGGNPTGHIFSADTSSNVFYFKAPGAFTGNQTNTFGGTLKFDLKSEFGTYVFNQEDVVLVGAGQTLVFDSPVVPDANWRTYTVPLSEGGWRVGSLSGPAASSVQMQTVLTSVTSLYIRGEFRGAMTDIGRLDNVGLLAPAAGPTSTFAATNEGWSVVDLKYLAVGSPPTVLGNFPAQFSATGGNPAGHVFTNDPTANVFYWSAPAAFLGDHSASYGASLAYDLQADFGSYVFNQEDVVLVGNGKTLVFDTVVVPDGTWQNYRVGLTEAGWRVGSLSGPAATEADMKMVLLNISALYIRGEFRGALNDIGRLDNVTLFTDPPPPDAGPAGAAPLPGDYDANGEVNSADYNVWRKNLGTTNVLPNDPIGGLIGADQYDLWRAHLGDVAAGGLSAQSSSVPEPTTLAVLLGPVLSIFAFARRARNPVRKS